MAQGEEKPQSDDPAYMAIWDQYKALKAENFKKERKLKAKYGPQAALDDRQGAQLRAEMVLEHVLPSHTVERLEFEIKWQELIKTSLDQLSIKIAEAMEQQGKKLITPDGPGGLILP